MKSTKKTLWIILAAVIAVWIAMVAVFWDVLVMYLAPQIPVGTALSSACDALQTRYKESPVPIFLRGYDEGGQTTAHLELRTKTGDVSKGALLVRSDLKKNQIQMDGTLPDETSLGSISIYLDRNFAALSSDKLLRGGYYGITYDTFEQDFRSIPLVSLLVPNAQLSQWTDSVRALQEKMNRGVSLPSVPNIPIDLLKKAPLALWVLRGRVSTENLDVNSQLLPCYKVVYRVDEGTARGIVERVAPGAVPQNAQAQLTCWLHQKSLVQMKLEAAAGEKQISLMVTLGCDAGRDDLAIEAAASAMGQTTVRIRKEGAWDVIDLGDTLISYQWDSKTGDLVLRLPEKEAVSMNLSEAESGFRVESPELGKIVGSRLFDGYNCTAIVTKGAEITTPDFKNLDQWSLEDLGIFLTGIWSVIKP